MGVHVDAVRDWIDLVIAIGGLFTLFTGMWVWINRQNRKHIIDVVQGATAQIRTDANGGQSLNDVNKHVNKLHERLEEHLALQAASDHKRDMQHQELKYELEAIKRIASYPAEGE